MGDDFKDKVIAITGAASGIGLAIAQVLYTRGATVAIADKNEEALNEAAGNISSIPGTGGLTQQVATTVLDVSKKSQVDAWITNTINSYGKIDGAANIAGIFSAKPSRLENTTEQDWDSIMDVNCKGVFNCLSAEMGSIKDGGAIVNAASVAGLIGTEMTGPYTASKHAVVGLTRVAAKEGASRKIRVNAIAPGVIDTPMFQKAEASTRPVDYDGFPLKRMGTPEEVAKLVAFLLSDDSSYQTGSIVTIDGGWTC